MTLRELKAFVNGLPQEMEEFQVVNGEVGYLEADSDEMVYRVDKPIIALYVDEDTSEICLFHQTQEDVRNALNPSDDTTGT